MPVERGRLQSDGAVGREAAEQAEQEPRLEQDPDQHVRVMGADEGEVDRPVRRALRREATEVVDVQMDLQRQVRALQGKSAEQCELRGTDTAHARKARRELY